MVSQHFRKIAISLLSSELTGRNQSRLKSAGTDVLPGCVIVFDRNACWDPVGSSFYEYRCKGRNFSGGIDCSQSSIFP